MILYFTDIEYSLIDMLKFYLVTEISAFM